ncbi:MAG: transposase [Candidatus Aminicenantales bacterium]
MSPHFHGNSLVNTGGVVNIFKYLQATTGTELHPGIVAVIQTSGDRINFHAHLHLLVTEGGEDPDGIFHHLAEFQDDLIAAFFSREVFALLLGEELISEALVEKIAGWRHSGFSVHSKVRAQTRKEAERVGKYMIHPLLSLERLSFSEKEGKVCYRYGKEAEEVERMDYLEFIARVTSHIPEKGQVTIRYLGLYANAHRGKRRKEEQEGRKLLIIEEECPRVPREPHSAHWLIGPVLLRIECAGFCQTPDYSSGPFRWNQKNRAGGQDYGRRRRIVRPCRLRESPLAGGQRRKSREAIRSRLLKGVAPWTKEKDGQSENAALIFFTGFRWWRRISDF